MNAHELAGRGFIAEPSDHGPAVAYVECSCGERFCYASRHGLAKLTGAGVDVDTAARTVRAAAEAGAEAFFYREHGLTLAQPTLF